MSDYIMYLRKSRADGDNETLEEVLAKHETMLQEYATRELGHIIPENYIYREVVSGETIEHRPMIQAILQLIETANIKGVLVVDPQRLSRGDLVDCGNIVNAFRYTNTLIMTPPMTYDLSNKMERKFFEQELMRGNDYLEYTKEILNRGRLASVKKGNYIGSIAPYGYKRVKTDSGHTLEIDECEADGVRIMYDDYINKNYGYARIALHLDELGIKPRKAAYWSPAAIKDMLVNPVYIGKIRWNRRKTNKVMDNGKLTINRPKSNDYLLIDGKHPAIISDEIFQASIAKRGSSPRTPISKEQVNPFAGILYCECGRAMVYRHRENSKSKAFLLCNGQTHCIHKSCLYEDMENSIIEIIEKTLYDFEMLIEEEHNDTVNSQLLTNLEKELVKLDAMDEEQHDLLESKIYSRETFLKRNAKLVERRQMIMKSIEDIKKVQKKRINYSDKIVLFEDALDTLKDPDISAKDKNMLLKKCFKKITYSRPTKGSTRWDTTPYTLQVELNI